jgi:hypothetical protein
MGATNLVEHELLTLLNQPSSTPGFNGVRATQPFFLSVVICPFVPFLLAIVLSVLRFMDSDYPFDIFKLFF